ncbi:protein TIC236, chloroplastic isoform X1 [Ziziphus jujuba]|uniref:Protein TIC236, chloroplastic isoform X1 n=1 Tax=Ziziphus jujuba TaxID=326968 RepID=A0A6P3ZZ47_ZIZJJ|nr:protein TIC236, chloroplastic isoform X1 [Ziziphus jujuba]XP_048331018.2 protein TIC236, chloroplastic isoform X1 [Ziziphus jujuba]
MSAKLHCSFLGVPLHSSLNGRNVGNFIYLERGQLWKRPCRRYTCAKQDHWITQVIRFSHFCGQNVELLRRSLGSKYGMKVKCVEERFSRSKALVRSLSPLWKEGLLLIRCSVFTAVISGVCLLVWYGQIKAKGFVEARILPSVCSVLSEYIQRELDFGKVRRISPLSITLESCSIGPHNEEFSCGEVPTMKIRVHPFASLRRGKIVVDAVLSHPSMLVMQKKNFTWLGLPTSEGSLQRHFSAEEGIDYRTKTRRIAREETAAQWERKRDEEAKKAAEMGYIVSDKGSSLSTGEILKEGNINFAELSNQYSFLCMDEKMHWRDHKCMDTGVDYEMEHADLEKSFGVKIPGSGLKFWSRVIKGPRKHKFKRKAKESDISASGVTAKRRILERSALAAFNYFQGLSHGSSGEPSQASAAYDVGNFETFFVESEIGTNANTSLSDIGDEILRDGNQDGKSPKYSGNQTLNVHGNVKSHFSSFTDMQDPAFNTLDRRGRDEKMGEKFSSTANVREANGKNADELDVKNRHSDDSQGDNTSSDSTPQQLETWLSKCHPFLMWPLSLKSGLPSFSTNMGEQLHSLLCGSFQKLTSGVGPGVDEIVAELADGVDIVQAEGIEKMIPVMLDSVHFKGGTLMLLGYGDREPREMDNVNGHVKFQNHYGRVHVQLSGNCKMWRSDVTSEDGGWLSADVFVDNVEQKWHANLKIANLFAPLFERILEIPIMWSKGRASGEVHLCMSRGETFPNLHGQLDVTGLAFKILDAPSWFSDISASLCFRGQRIFLHNTSGCFGDVPLEASGDFGINPEEGEFHLMCQVPCVEVNALMNTFKMKPLLFPIAGSVTAVFNCQGPLDAPIFVGSGMVSRKMTYSVSDFPSSSASEAVMKSKEAGAVAAFDRVPFSYLSANFTFNTDNCVADLYGIRASLVDGGEIRGAGNAWICPEGEEDDTAMDVNFSGSLCFDKIMHRYIPGYLQLMPLKLGELSGETKLSGSLFRPRFDIKWIAPKAEGSFSDARGDIIISHDSITVNSSSVAFELCTKVYTSYSDEYWLNRKDFSAKASIPFDVEGIELDLRMRGFEFFSMVSSYLFDSPKPMHLKATGKIKFQGTVSKPCITSEQDFIFEKNEQHVKMTDEGKTGCLVGDISISGLKLNQLMLAPQLAGLLSISKDCIKLDATGRPDESLAMEFIGPLRSKAEHNLQNGKLLSFSLQKGQLKANIYFQPFHSANLEVRHFPLDELELASLRGTIQKAELQLNLQKRRGHGQLSILRPKFSGVLGEALDVAARWSGDVITVEKTVLEQSNSRYELQGEYVLPGTRDRNPASKERGGFIKRAMDGHLGSVISSMGRWRMRLEVPRAEVAEMLPLARLISRSTDPSVHTRSKDLFIQSVQSVGLYTENVQDLLEIIHGHFTSSNEVILEDVSLPGLAELKGRWHGSLDASGGGNGDTMADFDFHGEDWEWGTYKTQRVLAVGAYSNDDGLRLEKIFIQKDNATIHADGTLLGPKPNLHFAVLNFPVSLVPTVVQIIESSATDVVQSLRQFLAPIRGILHMEGDLRGSLAKPECDVQVRLLDGAVGGIDLGRAEIVASLTSTRRFLFNAKFEPIIQNGHVHIQGSVPVALVQNSMLEEEDLGKDRIQETWERGWVKERNRGSADDSSEKKIPRERNEEGWDTQLAESLKGLNWNILDVGEVRVDADIKDGGMMLLTALSPYAKWLHGSADIMLQLRGTVEQPVLDGSASFYRASISSPVLWKPLTNFGGTVHVKSNRLCISSLESRVSRRGKLFVKGNLPLRTTEASLGDKIDLKCEVLEVRAKNILSAQVDSQMQITGSILQPNISGNIKLSHGEAYLPHDKGTGAAPNRMASNQSRIPGDGVSRVVNSSYVSRFFSSQPAASRTRFPQPSVESSEVEKDMKGVNIKPNVDIRLIDLKLVLGPELRIVYPLILNFAVSGELELDGPAHPERIQPKGILTFENGDVNLVATQVRLKQEHLNIAKFEPENGLDPNLDLVLVGSEWQFRIQSRASNWQDKLVVTSTRSVEQDALSPNEAARVFESQLAGSILEGNGQLAFQKLATTTLEKLMPRIEGKGEFGQARWRLVYAPQIPSLLSVDPTVDPLKSLASNISFGTEVEVQLGKRLQASIVRQMKDSEMAMQWTLIYQLSSRLRVLLQSAPSKRLIFEYSASSQD